MNNINKDLAVNPPPGYNFSWVEAQSTLVLTRDGNVISAVPLKINTAEEAQRRAVTLMEQLKITEQ